MLKKLLIIFITFITIFLPQSQAWATVNNSEKIIKEINISIDKSTFLAIDDSPALIARRERQKETNTNSIAWFSSIFIAGLGQILMGDFWRGFKFTLLVYGLAIFSGPLTYFFTSILNKPGADFSAVFSLILIYGAITVAILAIYIWNIIDAYIMSKELDKTNKADDEEVSELTEKLKVTINIINSSQISENGTVSVSAFSF